MSDGSNIPSEEDRQAQLAALDSRIQALKGEEKKTHMEEHYSQAQLVWRMVIELVAGLAIGLGVGMGLDWLFGTRPFLMIIFIFFGFAAGVKTMLRSAKEVQAAMEQGSTAPDGRNDNGD